jgi:hypothetical protein
MVEKDVTKFAEKEGDKAEHAVNKEVKDVNKGLNDVHKDVNKELGNVENSASKGVKGATAPVYQAEK